MNIDSQIVLFLRGKGFDYKGRKLNQLRALPDYRLERMHDVVQWMFPSDLPSKHHLESPVLTPTDIETMKEDVQIQDNLSMSLDRMLRFYEKSDSWITENNHNFLRMTRILRCLWLAGRTHDYVCLSRILDDIYIDYHDIIGQNTFLFWKHANDTEFMKNPEIYLPQLLASYCKTKLPTKKDDRLDGDDQDDLFNFR